MKNPVISYLTETVDLYGSAVELSLRASKILQNAGERTLREHLALVQSSLTHFEPVSQAETQDLFAAQTSLVNGIREQWTATTRNLLKIQQETGAEINSLFNEGTAKFSPEAVGKLFAQAA